MDIKFNRDNGMADVVVTIKPDMEASIVKDAVRDGIEPKIYLTNFALAILVIAAKKLSDDNKLGYINF